MPPPDEAPATDPSSAAGYYSANAAPAGSGLYYARLFSDPERQQQVLTLHTLENELLRSLTEVQDPGVARLRLQWWCEEIQRAAGGHARHPLAQMLQGDLLDGTLSGTELVAAIQALETDLTAGDCEDFGAMEDQYRRIFGPFWRLSAAWCGIGDNNILQEAARLGGLHHMSRALQDLPRTLQRGISRPLPRRVLESAGLTAETLGREHGDFLSQQIEQLQYQLDEAWQSFPRAGAREFLHGLILVRLDAVLLGEIKKDGASLFQHTHALTPIRRLWLGWRTRRQVVRQASE